MTANNPDHYEAYWPRAERRAKTKQLAPRLDTLNGKRIAFLWDFVFRGNEIFATIEEELRRRFENVNFVDWKEMGNIHGSDEREVVAALPRRLREAGADAVITAVAA